MKMSRLITVLFLVLYMLHCGQESDTVVGSRNHSLVIERNALPTVLADGVSTIVIRAVVMDDSGKAAPQMKVAFKTTAGTISDFALTDEYGVAAATLTSVASSTDLSATVTATVVDPAFSLAKLKAYSLVLSTPGFENVSLGKKAADNTDTITIQFLGVTLTATLKDSVLPADGLSQTQLAVKVVESNSQKPVKNASLVLSSVFSKIDAAALTDDQGKANVTLIAGEVTGVDTITVRLGKELSTRATVSYVQPLLKVSAKNQSIFADGASRTEIVAVLLTHKNTPVVGATIDFSTTDGRIQSNVVTDQFGAATAVLVAVDAPNPEVKVVASFLSVRDSITVSFIDPSGSMMNLTSDVDEILRDGVAAAQVALSFTGQNTDDFANRMVHLVTDYGEVPDSVITDADGRAVFTFTSDAGVADVVATVRASYAGNESIIRLKLVGLDVRVDVSRDSLPADGVSQAVVRVSVRLAGSKVPVAGYNVEFGVSEGSIERSGTTNEEGVVEKFYNSGYIPGDVDLFVYVGKLTLQQRVTLYPNYPSNIVLATENNFIWVKETGELEQTDITARLIGYSGGLVSDPYKVTFSIIQGPDGGERLETPDGYSGQSVTVGSVGGVATARLLSGARSGAALIRADIADYPQVAAQATRIVIRSGPPYMWVSPTDPDSVIQHGMIIVAPGQHNVAFANPVQEIAVTAFFSDKYNNPVEQGTAVYFTTTGGSISSDAVTDALGRTSVILQNVNPFPVLHSDDPNQYTATRFPNPNGDGSQMLRIRIPDFEGGVIPNSIGTTRENDGVATVIAITNGKNQYSEDIKVWAYAHVVFSVGIHTFRVWTDQDSIAPGQAANIFIQLWDMNGNPVASGSSLSVTSDAGEITQTDLMPPPERYGWGSTFFVTQLVNTLDPLQDEPQTATVKVELQSPNGDRFASLGIRLTL